MSDVSKHTQTGDAAKPASRPQWVEFLETNALLSWLEDEDPFEVITLTEAGRAALDQAQGEDTDLRELEEVIEQLNFWGGARD